MKHKKAFRMAIRKLLISSFLFVGFFAFSNVFAANGSSFSSLLNSYKKFVAPTPATAPIVAPTPVPKSDISNFISNYKKYVTGASVATAVLTPQIKISDLSADYKKYLTPTTLPTAPLLNQGGEISSPPSLGGAPKGGGGISLPIIVDSTLTSAIQKVLSQPSMIAKLRGPQGLKGATGAEGKSGPQGPAGIVSGGGGAMSPIYIPVGINQPDPNHNFTGASIFNATQLSSGHFTTNTANITDLTVTGSSTLRGDVSVGGNQTITGNQTVTGNLILTGSFTPTGAINLADNFTQTGAHTFSTGTGLATFNNSGFNLTATNPIIDLTSASTLSINTTTNRPVTFGSGAITIPNNVASKIYPASDSTTAIQINKADGTTNILNVDTTNSRIGIGTTDPKSSLHIEKNSSLTTFGDTNNIADQGIAVVNSNNTLNKPIGIRFGGFSGYTFGGLFGVMNNAGNRTTGDLVFASRKVETDFTYTEAMRITNGGNIGIGITNPSTTLDVNGVTTFRGNIIAGTDNTYDIGASGATRPRTGYFGTSVVNAVGAVGTPSYTFTGDTTTGFYQTGTAGFIGVASSGVNVATFGTPSGSSVTSNFFNVTGTLPTVNTSAPNAINFNITSAGISSQNQSAISAQLNAGYTGSNLTRVFSALNLAAGTGTSSWIGGGANYGITSSASVSVAGHNIGAMDTATGSSVLNLATLSRTVSSTNSPALNVGSASLAFNATTNIGGFFGLMNTAPTLGTSSALIADNGAVAADIFEARDNGTPVFTIGDGGTVTQTGNHLFSADNTYDIGASGATRPRTGYFGTSIIQGGALNLGAVSTDGIVLQNTTAAANNAQQYSPRLRLTGQGWGTTGSASQTTDFIAQVVPVQGTNPQSYLDFSSQINAGGYTNMFTIKNAAGIPKIGIGTTTPAVALDILSSAATFIQMGSSDSTKTSTIQLNNESGTNLGQFRVENSATANNNLINIPNSLNVGSGSGAPGGFVLYTATTAPMIFATGGVNLANEKGRIVDGTAGTGGWRFGTNTQGFFLDPLTTADTMIVRNFANTAQGKVLAGAIGLNSLVGSAPSQALDIQTGGTAFEYAGKMGASTAALAGAGAGNVDNGNHVWFVASITAQGYSNMIASNTLNVTDKTTNGQVTVTWTASTDPNVTGYAIYRTSAAQTSSLFAGFVATVSGVSTATYTDNIADASVDYTRRPGQNGYDTTSGGIWASGNKVAQAVNANNSAFGGFFVSGAGAFTPDDIGTMRTTYGVAPGFAVYGGVGSSGTALIATNQSTGIARSIFGALPAAPAAGVTATSTNTMEIGQNAYGTAGTTLLNQTLSGHIYTSAQATNGIWMSTAAGPIVFGAAGTATTNEMGRIIGGAAGTGIWRYGNNTQGFAIDPLTTADTMIVRNFANNAAGNITAGQITTTGNIGIGITNPSKPLTIVSTSNNSALSVTSATDNTPIAIENTGTSGRNFAIVSTSGASGFGVGVLAFVDNTSGGMRMALDSSGNLGIGATSSGARLHVKGASSDNTTNALTVINSGATSLLLVRDDGSVGISNSNPNSSYKLDVGGSVNDSGGYFFGVDTNWYVNVNSAYGNSDYGMRFSMGNSNGNDNRRWVFYDNINSVANAYITGTGRAYFADKIGIGTTAPSQALTVTGRLNVTTGGTSTESSATNGLNLGYDNNAEYSWIQSTREDTAHLRSLALNPLGGNVGIGTTNPLALLNVAKGTAPTTLTAANSYLLLGNSEAGANTYRTIGLGYVGGNTYAPAYMGYQEISAGGTTKGDLIFGTRSVLTDTQPTERMRIDNAGNVGIGTTTPTSPLHVYGVTSTATSFTDLIGSTRNVAGRLESTFTDSTAATGQVGQMNTLSVNPNAAWTGKTTWGEYIQAATPAANAQNVGTINGLQVISRHNGSGTAAGLTGIIGQGSTSTGSGTVTNVTGVNAQSVSGGVGTITNQFGLNASWQNSNGGTVGTAMAVYALMSNNNASSVVSGNAYGFRLDDLTNPGTITGTTYGMYLGDITTGTQTGGAFSVYASDANAPSYFAGNVGIGTTNPSQGLEALSTAAAGSFGTFASANGQGLSINPNNTAGIVNVYGDFLGGGSEPKLHLTTYSNRSTAAGITVDTAGNVGIGTTAPVTQLDVKGTVNTSLLSLRSSTDPGTTGTIGLNFGTGNYNDALPNRSAKILGFADGANDAIGLSFYTSNAGAPTEKVRIDKSGNVGIGLTNPTQKLDIQSGGLAFEGVGVMGAATATLIGSAGNINAGTHSYRVTAVTAQGESASTASNTVTTDAGHGQISVTWTALTDPNVTGYNIYRTVAGGTFRLFVANVSGVASNSYTDNTADASLSTSNFAGQTDDLTSGGIWAGGNQIGNIITNPASANSGHFWLYDKTNTPYINGILSQLSINGANSRTIGALNANGALIASAATATNGISRLVALDAEPFLTNASDGAIVGSRGIFVQFNNSATANTTLANIPLAGLVQSLANSTGGLVLDAAATSAPIIFGTGGAATTNERMRIDGSGNVGIGTTNPGNKLTIFGGSAATAIELGNNSGTGDTTLNFNGVNGATNAKYASVGMEVIGGTVGSETGSLYFSTISAGSFSRKMTILGSGNVGIGTTTPTTLLSLASAQPGLTLKRTTADATSAATIDFTTSTDAVKWRIGSQQMVAGSNFEIDEGNNVSNRFTILTGGNIGIGMTNPTHLLQLSTDDAAKPTSNTWTIVSDRRLKQNIQNFNDGLAVLTQINPVSYELNGKGGTPLGAKGIGIIAQDVKDIIPYTINTFQAKLNPDDTEDTTLYDFNSSALTFVELNAIKELNLNLESLTGTIIPAVGSPSETFMNAFWTNTKAKIGAWLADATNGISNIFAGTITAHNQLCINTTCVTEAQLQGLLAGSQSSPPAGGGVPAGGGGGSGGGSGNGGSDDTTPPVLTLNGDAVMNLNVGDIYNEPSAMGVDDKDSSVAIVITGSVDTTTVGTYTIHYNATDNAGNHAIEITRTVNVNSVTPPSVGP